MNSIALFFCFFFLLVGFKGYSQEVRIKLENCVLEKENIDRIQNALNFQLQFYQKAFNDSATSRFKARIFGTEKEFLKYSKEKADYNLVKHNAIAFYHFKLKEMILHKDIELFAETFSHELSHALLDEYCKNRSVWLDEGLAELFEGIYSTDSTYYFNTYHFEKIQTVKSRLLAGESIRETILSNNFYSSSADKNYDLAFATVLYLYKTNREILHKIIRNECGQETHDLSLSYPGGLDLLQIDVKAFFLNEKFSSN